MIPLGTVNATEVVARAANIPKVIRKTGRVRGATTMVFESVDKVLVPLSNSR
jgi:hypothetical protein